MWKGGKHDMDSGNNNAKNYTVKLAAHFALFIRMLSYGWFFGMVNTCTSHNITRKLTPGRKDGNQQPT
ncbi:hypothetical protein NVIE_1524 [Nitrososphaera viennensis EN76]|uniref:Uncharacterized protein n=1 Tax=Nitrososphaera viennensis EN76 TaxID=926571 RepID=A0A060HJP2_9ARCH|nr:hypothetical protein NVIE_1524 [Nitrososphaera viennensis EN76]